ncbi:hypothetical protein UY536_19890 [Paenibacillus polymyxa]|nr:hypothetical protein [Paenibacillus polymyxa]MDY7993021.1 hypothetical protein [Paenibacillus polymyxa]
MDRKVPALGHETPSDYLKSEESDGMNFILAK